MSQHIVKNRGDKFPMTLDEIQDDSGTELTDLTGWTFFFTLKLASDTADNDTAALIELDSSSGMTVSGGSVTWSVDTSSLSLDTLYIWDVQSKSPAGLIYTEDEGTLILKRDVTRRTTT